MNRLTTFFAAMAMGAALSLTAALGAVAADVDAGPAAAALYTSTQPAKMPVGVPGAWTQTFGDEFDGTTLDTNKWSRSWFVGSRLNGVQTDPANVSVSGGHLSLKLSNSGTGALVSSNPKDAAKTGYEFRTGYVEARISFPGQGQMLHNFPSWWTTGQSWPATGEIDIAEVINGKLTSNYHSGSGAYPQGAIPGYWGEDFHTYGLWRKDSLAEVYVDGVKVKSIRTDDGNAPHYLVLNVGQANTSAAYGKASTVKVDYVRAWK